MDISKEGERWQAHVLKSKMWLLCVWRSVGFGLHSHLSYANVAMSLHLLLLLQVVSGGSILLPNVR